MGRFLGRRDLDLGRVQRGAGQRVKGRGHWVGRGGAQRCLLSPWAVLQVSHLPEQQQSLADRSLCPSRFCPSRGCPLGLPTTVHFQPGAGEQAEGPILEPSQQRPSQEGRG